MMKLELNSSNRALIAVLVVVALAIAFWMLLLSPKRDEAAKLGGEVTQLEASLAEHTGIVQTALQARKDFPDTYRQLVVLGKAVPDEDDTASLLVQINKIAHRSKNRFQLIELIEGGEEAGAEAPVPASAPVEGPGSTTGGAASPTEVAASTLPLGATIGTAGLATMPYTLKFTGNFFTLADFIKGLDQLVKTENEKLEVTGRLITVNGFTLEPDPEKPFPALEATFSITTFLVPPEQGTTAGASPTEPAPAEATPAATTTGGTP
jgi:Tfp pilus assembly protein PilO